MNAAQVLALVDRKYPECAIVHEVVVTDDRAYPEFKAALDNRAPDVDPWTIPRPVDRRRIDALMLDGSGTRTAIEVKVSRADFRRETEAKRAAWRRITNRFVYVAPWGVIDEHEVPRGCGLWLADRDGLTVARRASINREPDPLPHQVVVALAYRLDRQRRDAARDIQPTEDRNHA